MLYILHVTSLSHYVNGTSHFNPSLQRFLNCNIRGFIEGWEPGKLTSCGDDFAQLVRASSRKCFIEKLSSNSFALLIKNNIDEPPESRTLTKLKMLQVLYALVLVASE